MPDFEQPGGNRRLTRWDRRFAELFDRFWSPAPGGAVPQPHFHPPHKEQVMQQATPTSINETRLNALMNQLVMDAAATATAPLVLLGDRLGLYKAMAGAGPITSAELADRTGTHERYVREWLSAQAAAGYVDFDAASERFTLTPEQAMAFADEHGPAFFVGAFETMGSVFLDREKIEQAFRTGKGVGWHEHDSSLFCGVERFFRSGYTAHLVQDWLPALDGVTDKLRAGARVADIGCGHGASTILMAQAFPQSQITGFDYHQESITQARATAARSGLDGRARFETATAKDFPGDGYDLVTIFDALHDMGDPVGAARHVREALAPDGAWMIVEPLAGDNLAANLNPVGRLYYAASTMICTPGSLAQEVGLGLGAQAGEARLRDVLQKAGFTRVRRATETPFNMVLEARP
ncbi:class I SAM-dependent methyltransferase [Sphingomonas sp. CCH5-D11]|uniref:class I SAM-dependent methyltransferase n=1 Tax=Sphingomonas sp. CCH5-D11 TaxID=1768786 RepID=UPI000A604643|nr:class I SAM-dependent methyltransferase [Sphingomonas sp. CCH5-D11]